MKLLVTGARGYIGTAFINAASQNAHNIIIASRQKPFLSQFLWYFFDLESANELALPFKTDVIVHLAANTTQNNALSETTEVLAAKNLIHYAKKTMAKFIFVSSQTAQLDASTAYGRIKWRIEQEVLSAGGWIVRPGQVYGGELGGLFETLVNGVRKSTILPAFLPSPKVQPIHVDELAAGLLCIAERSDIPSGIYCLASPELVSFSIFLKAIAKSRLRCWRILIPVPTAIMNATTLIIGKKLRTRLGLERLQSLFNLPIMDTQSDLTLLNIKLRPFLSGMHPSGDIRRRGLLQEGKALLTFIMKKSPESALLRRYTHVIEQLRDGQPLGLPATALSYPKLLSLFSLSEGEEFSWRMDAATILAETTPAGARRFLNAERKHGLLRSLFSIATVIMCELFWRLLGVAFSPLFRHFLMRNKVI